MAQGDLNVANQSGAAFRADVNNQLLALGTLQSGAAEPSPTYAYQLWADTTNALLKQRNGANNAWVTIGSLDTANWGHLTTSGVGTITSTMIADGTIVNADINASAAIAGSKVDPNFGSQALICGSQNGGPLAGFRNVIINGGMEIAQRGTSFASPASGAYGIDRWRVPYDESGATRTISQQALSAGDASTFPGAQNFIRFAQSVAGSGGSFNFLDQPIESVRTLEGQTVTLSFYAKATSAITLPRVRLSQYFGSGGSAQVDTVLATSISVGTSWARYSYSVTLPSISGKTITSSDALLVQIWAPVNSTFTLDITGVQLEPGTVATPFERRPYGTELALCQRYFQKLGSTFTGITEGTTIYAIQIPYWAPMRVTPTTSVASGGIFSARYNTTDITITDPTVQNPTLTPENIWIQIISSGLTGALPVFGRSLSWGTNGTTDFLLLNAEL